jgi:hypothetical protein
MKSHGTGPRRAFLACAAVAALAGALVLTTTSADARSRRSHGYESNYVVAHSDFGNGSVSGPVRQGRRGWQVRMPGGTWIDCVRSCSDTLRRQTVDFWESNFRDGPGSGRGYLRWDFSF